MAVKELLGGAAAVCVLAAAEVVGTEYFYRTTMMRSQAKVEKSN